MRSAWFGLLLLTACASGTESRAGGTGDATTVSDPAPTSVAVPLDTDDGPIATSSGIPEGFDATQAVVTKADGTTCEICVWRAETTQQRARGLMFATDLGAADAMTFRYAEPHSGTFWMKNTVLPLSIAFFDPDGSFLESFDMEPCTTASCPSYATPADFLVAVEVPQGGLDELGLVAGSHLRLVDLSCAG